MLVTLSELLKDAKEEKYAVGRLMYRTSKQSAGSFKQRRNLSLRLFCSTPRYMKI